MADETPGGAAPSDLPSDLPGELPAPGSLAPAESSSAALSPSPPSSAALPEAPSVPAPALESFPAPEPVECPRCGAPNAPAASRCVECGYRFYVRCPRCGAVNDGEATACKACGHHLISAAHGAWTVGPPRPAPVRPSVVRPSVVMRGSATGSGIRRSNGARGGARRRRGLTSAPQGHSPLFFLIVATGAIVLVLGVLLVLLILAQNPHLLDGSL